LYNYPKLNKQRKEMAILSEFKQVKEGAMYRGMCIDHICVDTEGHMHLQPVNDDILNTTEAVAILHHTHIHQQMSRKERMDVMWLWDNIRSV